MEHSEFSSLAKTIRYAGTIALTEQRKGLRIETKGQEYNIVTEADWKVERYLKRKLRRLYPAHTIVAEESGGKPSEKFWVIDPIDSTVFFSRGERDWSITIAEIIDGQVERGIVYCPPSGELFYAQRDQGAFLGRRRLQVSDTQNMNESLVNLGQDAIRMYKRPEIDRVFIQTARAHSVIGSGALALARLAAGKSDVAIHMGQRIWDFAAGSLLVTEAGGRITLFDGTDDFSIVGNNDNNIVASNGLLHDQALDMIRSAI